MNETKKIPNDTITYGELIDLDEITLDAKVTSLDDGGETPDPIAEKASLDDGEAPNAIVAKTKKIATEAQEADPYTTLKITSFSRNPIPQRSFEYDNEKFRDDREKFKDRFHVTFEVNGVPLSGFIEISQGYANSFHVTIEDFPYGLLLDFTLTIKDKDQILFENTFKVTTPYIVNYNGKTQNHYFIEYFKPKFKASNETLAWEVRINSIAIEEEEEFRRGAPPEEEDDDFGYGPPEQ